MSKKIRLIIEREYLTKVRRKSFMIMSVLGPLLFVGVFGVIAFLASINKDNKIIAIYDETSLFTETFQSDSETVYVYLPSTGFNAAIDTVKARSYYGLLHIPFTRDRELGKLASSIEFYSEETPSMSQTNKMREVLERRLRSLKLKELGTSDELVNNADLPVKIKFANYLGELKESKFGAAQIVIGAFAGIMIYMFIFVYGVQVMRSVIEEKTNRIVEVIISSIKPFELMMGKIIGSALVGLTQFSIWMILSGVLMSLARNLFGIERPTTTLASEVGPVMDNKMEELLYSLLEIDFGLVIGTFVFFFLGGYLLYSALFAAVGSAVDSETDTQQFMLPITLPLIIAMYSGFMVLENPNGPVAFWMSMIPLTSPVVMMARIPFDVPTWQIFLSASILIVGFIIATLIAAKVYKTGILMYGKKPSYREIWKWLKYKN